MSLRGLEIIEKNTGKELYNYQKGAIDKIFKYFDEAPDDFHLLYQLPTGGGRPLFFLKWSGSI